MKEHPDLSIVVLNYNTSDLLNDALGSIVSTVGGLEVDVTVIDNASTDGGFARVDAAYKNDSRFRFVENKENTGWAIVNMMLETTGTYILTLDPDAKLHAGTAQALMAFMDRTPNAGAATAKLLNPDGSLQFYYRRIMTPLYFFFTTLLGRILDKYFLQLRYFKRYRYEGLDVTKVSEVEQPALPCLIWRREAVGDCIIDPKLAFQFTDVDMCKRLYDRGYKIYLVPDAVATHLKSTSYARRASAWRRRVYNRSIQIYFWKHYPLFFPAFWVLFSLDRTLRALLRYTTGREPLQ
jgi:GT2 family glycosyltransferase